MIWCVHANKVMRLLISMFINIFFFYLYTAISMGLTLWVPYDWFLARKLLCYIKIFCVNSPGGPINHILLQSRGCLHLSRTHTLYQNSQHKGIFKFYPASWIPKLSELIYWNPFFILRYLFKFFIWKTWFILVWLGFPFSFTYLGLL